MEFVVVELIVIIQSGTELVYPKKWGKKYALHIQGFGCSDSYVGIF